MLNLLREPEARDSNRHMTGGHIVQAARDGENAKVCEGLVLRTRVED